MQVPLPSDLCAKGQFPAWWGMQKMCENISAYALLHAGTTWAVEGRKSSSVFLPDLQKKNLNWAPAAATGAVALPLCTVLAHLHSLL